MKTGTVRRVGGCSIYTLDCGCVVTIHDETGAQSAEGGRDCPVWAELTRRAASGEERIFDQLDRHLGLVQSVTGFVEQ